VRPRLLLIAASAAVLVAGAVASGGPAGAAQPGCTIKDVTPHELVIGGRAPSAVQFAVDTTCPVDADVNWYLTVHAGPPGPYGWLMRANFWQPPWSRFQWAPGGMVGLGLVPQSYLGENDLSVTAYNGEPGESTPMGFSRKIAVKLGTTFDGRTNPSEHFDAEPETVAPGGTLTLTGWLQQAKLDAGEYESDVEPLAGPVVVQYRADGSARYSDVKTVQAAADGSVTATVTAKRSGTWRLRYAGDATHAASRSAEDHVTVAR
jgi:hypothetical protein